MTLQTFFVFQPFERPKPLSSRQVRYNNVEAGLPLEKDTKHTFKAKWTLGHYPIKGKYKIKIFNSNDESMIKI